MPQNDRSRKLAGRWGFEVEGERAGVGPVRAVGSFRLDKDGDVKDGKQTVSFNGTVLAEEFTGTFDVADDGTGTAQVNVTGPKARQVNFAIVVVDKGDEILGVFTDPGTTSTFRAKRIEK